MTALLKDVRYAIRALLRARGFSAVAVTTLAIGIGANTAIFSVVDAVLLKPLAFREPDALVRVTADLTKRSSEDVGLSAPEFLDLRDKSGLFENISGLFPINVNLTEVETPERIEAQLVSGSYFQVLGVDAALGRVFSPADEIPGITEIAVITDGLWKRRFGADRGVIGRRVRLDNDMFEIIGVLPAGFQHPGRGIDGAPQIFAPAGYLSTPFPQQLQRFNRFLSGGAIGRLKTGVTAAQAQARLADFGATLTREYTDSYPATIGWTPRLISLQDDLVGRTRPALLVLLACVGAVLLVACANVANLLLARASTRQREFAVRAALGATRGRLARQLFTESIVLSLVGGALGILVAQWLVAALITFAASTLPRIADIAIDGRVLLFSLVLSGVTGLIFGLWPALQVSTTNPFDTLKDSTRAVTGSVQGARLRSGLVVAEIAIALVLLVTAALFVRSFSRLYAVDPGFSTDGVLAARLWMPQPNDPKTGPYFVHEKRVALYQQTRDRILALPGVEAAGWSSRLPFTTAGASQPFWIEGRPIEMADASAVEPALATPGYFEALGVALRSGRYFTDDDNAQRPAVLIISESLATKYFPGEDPIGKRIRPGNAQSTAAWFTIVGVVADVRSVSLERARVPQMYRAAYQFSSLAMALVVKTKDSEPARQEQAVRAAVRAVDPNLPLFSVKPMASFLDASLSQRRFAMTLVGAFALFALALASVGVYGVLAYLVTQRTREIGVRMALGAEPGMVVRMVIMEGGRLAAIGLVIGLVGAVFAARAISTQLFGIRAYDPVSYLAIVALLAGVSLLACIIPARRAMRIDPLTALRED